MAQLSGKKPIAFVNFSIEKLSKILFWSFCNCFNKNISAFLCSFFDFFTYWSCKWIWLYQCYLHLLSRSVWVLAFTLSGENKTWIFFFPMLLIYKLFSGPLLSCFGPSFVSVLQMTFGSLSIFHTHGMFHYEYFLEPPRALLKPQTILELFPKSFCPCFRRILPVHFCISQMEPKHFIHSVNLFQ